MNPKLLRERLRTLAAEGEAKLAAAPQPEKDASCRTTKPLSKDAFSRPDGSGTGGTSSPCGPSPLPRSMP